MAKHKGGKPDPAPSSTGRGNPRPKSTPKTQSTGRGNPRPRDKK